MKKITEDVLVLSIDHYEVKDEVTSQLNAGTTCWYYPNAGLDPIDNSAISKGVKPAKMALAENFLRTNPDIEVPCLATVTYVMRPDSKGKLQLTAVDFVVKPGTVKLALANAPTAK